MFVYFCIQCDPMKTSLRFSEIGSHLTPLPRLEAITRVHGKYRSNNDPSRGSTVVEAGVKEKRESTALDKIFELPVSSVDAVEVQVPVTVVDFTSPVQFAEALGTLHAGKKCIYTYIYIYIYVYGF